MRVSALQRFGLHELDQQSQTGNFPVGLQSARAVGLVGFASPEFDQFVHLEELTADIHVEAH